MNKGIPDCLDCGGKGMCEKHKLEYLYYEYDKAHKAFRAEQKKQKDKAIASAEKIFMANIEDKDFEDNEKNELSSS